MNKKTASKILAVVMGISVMSSAVYADSGIVSRDNIYADAIDFVTSNSIMEGDEKGNLNLDKCITRAEFVKMLLTAAAGDRLEKEAENVYSQGFADVGDGHWAKELIEKAHACSFIDGYDDGLFHPEDKVTYAQAIKLILAMCGINTYNTVYPYGYIAEAVIAGVIEDMEFKPDEPITRRATAELMFNAYGAVKRGMIHCKDMNTNYSDKTEIVTGFGIYEQVLANGVKNLSTSNMSTSNSGSAGGGMSIQEVSSQPASSTSSDKKGSETTGGGSSASVVPNKYFSTEEYTAYTPNSFRKTSLSPLSTFSADTDTASYSNMRRFISMGKIPEANSIRTEEIINYFYYDTPQIEDNSPIGVTAQITDCPWSENKLARITVAAKESEADKPSNLVFVIDVSGSMASLNKLPMLKKALLMLIDELDAEDTVSIVTYSGRANVSLEPTKCNEKNVIKESINNLSAGGGTNGADGLNLAYELLEEGYNKNSNNRLILCSDGDFNIGPSSTSELEKMITEKRKSGIYLTTVGFGVGNYKDNRMELMADKGNGSYYYIDNMREAKKVFVEDITKTLYTVADDVKLQVEFNPGAVAEYRLVGYENRILNAEDFNNDTVDAGEMGSGAKITVLYELVMGNEQTQTFNGEYRYQTPQYIESNEAFDVKVRYKNPGETESILKEFPITNEITEANNDTKFASAAAMLGLKLNGVIDIPYSDIADYAKESVPMSGDMSVAERWEFIQLTALLGYIN